MTIRHFTFWAGWAVTAAAFALVATTGASPWLIPSVMLAWLAALAAARICEHQP
ncbi:hypothetical protein ACIBKY_03370 [Nonomuraea sp. NPDC050394]|uniref:hypothetical protein n=1 Tax=Nonomuraea sp. NPDC050394 TaxID=3364363 RepID=UPI0037A27CBD